MTKRGLFIYAFGLTVFLVGRLWLETRMVRQELATARRSVLGAQTLRRVSQAPVLPPYPLLTTEVPTFGARQYALYDVQSGVFLIEQQADAAVPLASTTKIMTALLALEAGDNGSVVTIDEVSANQIGSTAGLTAGEQLTVTDLLYGALLNSGNDAAFALAQHYGQQQYGGEGSSDNAAANFVIRMNQRAQELKLTTLQFKDPTGLAEDNVGSAHDLAKLAAFALERDDFRQIVSTAETTISDQNGQFKHQLKNSNRLVSDWQYPGAIGVKTGFTPTAGHNLVGAIEYDGHRLIAVVLNTYDNTITASAEVARSLFDFAQRAIEWH